MNRQLHYIDGEFVASADGGFLDNVEPATGSVYAQVAAGRQQEVDLAVAAARRAFPDWAGLPASERAAALHALADGIERRLEDFARAESIDSGKPLSLARSVDIPRAVANFRFFAGAVLHTSTEAHTTDRVALNYTLRNPLGVVGLISPWNLPLYLLSWKIAPALATGNTAVAKPSELAPATATLLAEVCRETSLPRGVLNIVHGLGVNAGASIVAHADVKAISFTGGTATGRTIAATAAPQFKKLALELGGKNPNLVFDDCDLEDAIETSLRAAFSNQGQICLCGSRILVQRSIHDAFVERFVEATAALRSGDPLDEATEQGALISAAHLEKVRAYIELAKNEGGELLVGGNRPDNLPARCSNGFFLRPTVVAGLGPECRTNQEEIFGPVVTIQPFDDEDQAVSLANATPYGLAATLWTRDLARAHRLAERIQAGILWINCWLLRDLRVPFGGMKQSGVGREGGNEALRFFTEPKNVCIRFPHGPIED